MNRWAGVGRLGQQVELRYTPKGKPLARVLLAVDRVPVNGSKGTDWVRLVLWGKQAEVCAQYAGKGSLVAVEGRLSSEWYEREGRKELATEVVVERIDFLALRPVNGTASARTAEAEG
jgi:single-strand DNA-binding protein